MNPAMLAQFGIPILGKLLGGGKLDALLPSSGLGPLKEVFDGSSVGPEQQVLAAIASLAEHAPADKGKAKDYADALGQIMQGLAVVKALVAQGG